MSVRLGKILFVILRKNAGLKGPPSSFGEEIQTRNSGIYSINGAIIAQ